MLILGPRTYKASTANLEFIIPNSLLRPHGNFSPVLRKNETDVWQDEQDSSTLERILDVQEEILNNCKSLWYKNYSLSLREHSRNVYQSKWENKIKVGDIVLIKTINRARPFWMMDRVLELVVGFHNKIRSVKLKQGNGAIEYHSISNLYPMEISIRQAELQAWADVGGSSENRVVASPQIGNRDSNEGSVQPGPSNISFRPNWKATERFCLMLRVNLDDM